MSRSSATPALAMASIDRRGATNHADTSSNTRPVGLTREEWQFLQHYRQCSTTDQDLIARALVGDAAAICALEARR